MHVGFTRQQNVRTGYLEPRIDNRSELMGVVSVHVFIKQKLTKMAKLKQTSLFAFAN